MKCGNCGELAKKVISVLPSEKVDDSRNAPNLVMKVISLLNLGFLSCELSSYICLLSDVGSVSTNFCLFPQVL